MSSNVTCSVLLALCYGGSGHCRRFGGGRHMHVGNCSKYILVVSVSTLIVGCRCGGHRCRFGGGPGTVGYTSRDPFLHGFGGDGRVRWWMRSSAIFPPSFSFSSSCKLRSTFLLFPHGAFAIDGCMYLPVHLSLLLGVLHMFTSFGSATVKEKMRMTVSRASWPLIFPA